MASGKEFEGSTRWQQTPEGWLPAPFTLTKEWKFALPAFDAASGDRLPPRPPRRKCADEEIKLLNAFSMASRTFKVVIGTVVVLAFGGAMIAVRLWRRSSSPRR
jgi:hypothetical protein